MGGALFDRIESISGERFFSESLLFILGRYKEFKHMFLEYIFSTVSISEKEKLLNDLQSGEILSESYYENSRIDLEFCSPDKTKRLFIEIKVDSPEGNNQVQRYLNLNKGYVLFLTPRGTKSPKVKRQTKYFLGHYFIENICTLLSTYNNGEKSEIIDEFIKYLEVRDMGEIKPLTKSEINIGNKAFDFFEKSTMIIEVVKKEIEPFLVDHFGDNVGKTKVTSGADWGEINWWFQTKLWKKKGFFLSIGVCQTYDPKPSFFVSFGSNQIGFSNHVESDDIILGKLKKLEKRKWGKIDSRGLDYTKLIDLEEGSIDKLSKKLVKKTKETISELSLKDIQIITLLERRMNKKE